MSGFQGYDAWKTASPYDDEPEMPVLENLIPGFAVTCPCCGELASFDTDIRKAYEDELHDEVSHEWHCEECDWSQETTVEDWVRAKELTPEFSERRNKIISDLNALRERPVPIFNLASLNLPADDFKWISDDAGDWTVYCCGDKDCPVQWHKEAYTFDIVREDGVLTLTSMTVDEDGNWECDDEWTETDGPFEESTIAYTMSNQSNEYFIGWTEYWLNAAQTMSDPCYDARKSVAEHTPREWIEFCLKSAEENLAYLSK